jgi:SPX domain protein involved in polyphosphate accumulation
LHHAPPGSDAQLINSVYFDNENLELYHGRLDKKPGAIAVRIRCALSRAQAAAAGVSMQAHDRSR